MSMAKKILIVSNKQDHTVNYSNFVDSCDVVFRVNKLDNIHSGLVGTKTDVAVVWPNVTYWKYTPQQQNIAIVRNVKDLFVVGPANIIQEFVAKYNIPSAKQYPVSLMPYVGVVPHFWTCLAKTVKLADVMYPSDELYFLGDVDCVTRSSFDEWDILSDENDYLNELVESGRMKVVTEKMLRQPS